jgi:hypothetical protein
MGAANSGGQALNESSLAGRVHLEDIAEVGFELATFEL